jgi:hypothetical protein
MGSSTSRISDIKEKEKTSNTTLITLSEALGYDNENINTTFEIEFTYKEDNEPAKVHPNCHLWKLRIETLIIIFTHLSIRDIIHILMTSEYVYNILVCNKVPFYRRLKEGTLKNSFQREMVREQERIELLDDKKTDKYFSKFCMENLKIVPKGQNKGLNISISLINPGKIGNNMVGFGY